MVNNLRTGDTLACYGRGFVSWAIRLWTGLITWRACPSHVAGIAIVDGEPLVFECTTLSALPDHFDDRPRSGVQAHVFKDWLAAYPGRVDLHRIKDMTISGREALKEYVLEAHDRQASYDKRQAFHSASPIRNTENGEEMFCSSFWSFALRAGRVIPYTINPSEQHPGDVIRFKCLHPGVRIK